MKLKENLTLKILAFLLALIFFAAAAAMTIYQVANFSALWEDYDTQYGYTAQQLLWQARDDVEELLFLSDRDGSHARRRTQELEAALDAQSTNLRWQVRQGETVLRGNAQTVPEYVDSFSYTVYLDGTDAAEPGDAPSVTDTELSGEGATVRASVVLWLEPGLPIADEFSRAHRTLLVWKDNRVLALAGTAVCFLLCVLLTVYLCVGSGHKKGREGIYLCWLHRIPGDLLLCVLFAAGVLLCAGVAETFNRWRDWPFETMLILADTCVTGIAALAIVLLVSVCARCKAHRLLRGNVIAWLCTRLWRVCRGAANALPLVWKTALCGAVYLIFSLLLAPGPVWLLVSICVVLYLCWWAFQWKKVRRGAGEIIGGNITYQINSGKMPPDLRAHAGELNNLGQAISAAVEDRMRSERFKAELITNVSHDLKTPLTSIISYVDLLKKENIDDPKVREYIEVLERKSQRLKKLTEDLVEASKASTGALRVERERIDLAQLADQALGEYEQRLGESGLSVVRTLPAQPVWVMADGRHLWRIIDNLLSNCGKYALEGTRVYVEVQQFAACAKLWVKNISREKLDIPAQQLTERFVRGDESRTMEGSGLGLSIAQSLAELQQGSFEIAVDGDLFKAVVTLPLAQEQ